MEKEGRKIYAGQKKKKTSKKFINGKFSVCRQLQRNWKKVKKKKKKELKMKANNINFITTMFTKLFLQGISKCKQVTSPALDLYTFIHPANIL